MLRILYCLRHQHDWKLVILAAVVCTISCVVAVVIIDRALGTKGIARARWVMTAGAAAGFGIWATHFIAMLAFDPGLHVAFDLRLTFASLLVAMLITAGGIEIAISRSFRNADLVGGAVIGSGIASMHYVGMMALDLPGRIVWATDLIAVSIVLAMGLGALTMRVLGLKSRWRYIAPALFVLAIVIHHFTGMGAVSLRPDPTHIVSGAVLSPESMSIAITFAAIAVLTLCVLAVVWGRRLDQVQDESNLRFRVLLEGIEDYAIFLLDPNGLVMDWNSGGERINLYRREDIVGRNYADVCALDPDYPRQYREGLKIAEAEGRFEIEGPCIRADGKTFWGHTLLRALRDETGKLIGFANITQEITERKAAEDQAATAAKNLDAALANMSQGLCLFDRNERLILSNRRFADLYEIDPDFVRPGVSFRELLIEIMTRYEGRAPDLADVEAFHARHRALIMQPQGGVLVSDYVAHRIISMAHRPLPEGGWVSTFEDISERRASEARIAHMARHDGLTGLPNRVHFNEYLDNELIWAHRHGEQVAVIAIDLDRFKEINDQHGHATGDLVLKAIAERMAILLKDGEFVARFGNDEFAAIKRYQTGSDLDDFIARVRGALSDPLLIAGAEINVNGSIGASLYPHDGSMREALLNNADLALYRAKATQTTIGGEKLCFFNAGMDEVARERRALSKDLERALKHDEFRLFYQIQQSVQTGEITGYEALIRWKHPVRGFVSPADFIAVAEESGAIIDIGAWVLKTACIEAASWNNTHKIAVNLSPVQLNDVRLIELVQRALIESGLAPSRLELEITESTIIDDKTRALELLRQIKALGVTIAIDDFGTGYASLDTLNSFPFDKIKIDRSFLMEADKSLQARAIVRAILALGRSLEIPVLAEGVETESQMQLLREEGCHEAQGYLLGRPVEHIVHTLPLRAAS